MATLLNRREKLVKLSNFLIGRLVMFSEENSWDRGGNSEKNTPNIYKLWTYTRNKKKIFKQGKYVLERNYCT